ncbi:hypothetical protein HanIR_Chr11g0558661 [Helianthus annuus]|nr:hypothetical protein HanIR_Chr11g0558661 [Helianthus annuus]
MIVPISSEINYTGSKHIFHCLYCPFALCVCLRMISCASIYHGSHCFLETCPKMRCKTTISIRYNR